METSNPNNLFDYDKYDDINVLESDCRSVTVSQVWFPQRPLTTMTMLPPALIAANPVSAAKVCRKLPTRVRRCYIQDELQSAVVTRNESYALIDIVPQRVDNSTVLRYSALKLTESENTCNPDSDTLCIVPESELTDTAVSNVDDVHVLSQPAPFNVESANAVTSVSEDDCIVPVNPISAGNSPHDITLLSADCVTHSEYRIIDGGVPWDPGEIYEYNKSRTEYNSIDPEKLGAHVLSGGQNDGPYVKIMINGYESLFLVDTGASHTTISKGFAKFIGLIHDSDKPDPSIKGTSAAGTDLTYYGFKSVELQLGSISMTGEVAVGDVSENGFLGMDVITKAGAVINFEEMFIQLYDQKVPMLSREGKRLVNPLFTKSEVRIPGKSQCIIDLDKPPDGPGIGLVEPRDSTLAAFGLFGARNLGLYTNLKIKLANPSAETVIIPRHTSIAYFSQANLPSDADAEIQKREITVNKQNLSSEMNSYSEVTLPEHVKTLYENLPSDISGPCKEQVKELLHKYQDVFSTGDHDMGYNDWIPHEIKLKEGAKPIRQAPYRVGHHASQEIEKHVQNLLDLGHIERAQSAWSSPVLLIPKKSGQTRFVQDYRKVNACTVQDTYPLPRLDDSLEALQGAKYFTTVDLQSGYWQVAMSPEAKQISSFVTKSGVYAPNRLMMGLCSASHTFERLMETVLRGLQWEELLVYLDDIIVFSSNEQDHVERLDRMLARLKEANLKIKPSKTCMFQREVEYLGHIVCEQGIKTDPKKIEAINRIPQPTAVKELRSLLGLTGYYRRFIPRYGEITKPLCRLLKKKIKFAWDELCTQAFVDLKQALTSHTILAYPDYSKPFILDTDCSKLAMGAVLSQLDANNEERPIAYFSKALNDAQSKYSITKMEMLALVSAIRHFKPYLYGAKFECRVDHHSLIWLQNMKEPQGILARWLETLSNYNFTVIHRPGRHHLNADALSRLGYDAPAATECHCKSIALTLNQNTLLGDSLDSSSEAENSRSENVRAENSQNQNSQISQDENSQTENSVTAQDENVNSEVNETSQLSDSAVDNNGSIEIDNDRIIELQKADPDLKKIRDWVENEIEIPAGEYKKLTLAQRFYLAKRPSLRIRDDLLIEVSTDQVKVVVPQALKNEIMENFHKDDHAGMDRLYKRIALYYLWFRMQTDIREFVQLCEACQLAKYSRTIMRDRNLTRGAIMDQVSLDIAGSFTPTKSENTVILIAVEHFSRWAEAYPLPAATAEYCAKALYNGMFSRFGFPRIIHSDRGKNFTAELMSEFAKLGQSKNTFSCRYHPCANGYSERQIQTLKNSIRASVQENTHDWDEMLDTIMMAYRATPHSGTGFSPNRMMLGREARLAQVFCPVYDSLPITDYVKKLDEILHTVYNKQRNLQAEESFCDMAIHKPFKEGDQVLIMKKKSALNKPGAFDSRYYGPCKIIKVLDFDSYVVDDNGTEVIEHHSRLKKFRSANILDGENQPPPIEFSDDSLDTGPLESTRLSQEDNSQRKAMENQATSMVRPSQGDMVTMADFAPINDNEQEASLGEHISRRHRRRPAWWQDYEFDYE